MKEKEQLFFLYVSMVKLPVSHYLPHGTHSLVN